MPTTENETAAEFMARMGTNAEAWAREYMKMPHYHDHDPQFRQLTAWFHNAIEAGRHEGPRIVRVEGDGGGMNDNDDDMPPETSPGLVEASIGMIEGHIEVAVLAGHIDNEDGQNAIVAEAAFRWLKRRMGGPAIVRSMMNTIATMHLRASPTPPEAA